MTFFLKVPKSCTYLIHSPWFHMSPGHVINPHRHNWKQKRVLLPTTTSIPPLLLILSPKISNTPRLSSYEELLLLFKPYTTHFLFNPLEQCLFKTPRGSSRTSFELSQASWWLQQQQHNIHYKSTELTFCVTLSSKKNALSSTTTI